ncbi:MAG TPA: HAD-IA family hydrolase, partial [Vicinamibacteria bacterium]|nr:HAD-IA family hydrolase [Vicinamibacteria bacterium]
RVFPEFGIPFDRSAFQRSYSPDWYHTYRLLGLPPERWAEADARWLEQFACEPPLAIAGAREAVRRLREAGLRLGLVTSGSRQRVPGEIEALGFAGVFEAVVCAGDYERRKPHPEALLLALERMAVAPAQSAYVGDSPEDVLMAQAAGVLAVGIPGGFPNREQLEASAPALLAPTLEAAVDELLSRLGPARRA